MARVIWTASALDDIDKIADFVAKDSAHAAAKLVERLLARSEQLERFPFSGSVVNELKHEAYRELIVGTFRMIYRVADDICHIVWVVHASQDFQEALHRRHPSGLNP